MTVTIGRLTGLPEPMMIRKGKGRLSWTAWAFGSTLTETHHLRNSLEALGELGPNQSGFTRIQSTNDPTIDGYYWIDSLDVDSDAGEVNHKGFKYNLSATRCSQWQGSRLSWRTDAAARSGAATFTITPNHWHAVPDNAKSYDRAGATTVAKLRTGLGYSMRYFAASGYSGATSPTGIILPANFFEGSPYISVDGYVLEGKQILSLGNTDDSWALYTNLVKVTGSASASYTFRLYFPDYNTNTVWATTPYDIQIGIFLSGSFKVVNVQSVQVLDYTPEVARLLLVGNVSTTGTKDYYEVTIELRLRRGSRILECGIGSQVSANHGVKDNAAVTYAAVAGTGAYARNADDTAHNKLVIAYNQTPNTGSVGSGFIYTNSATTSSHWGFGCEFGGSSSASPDQQADVRNDYFSAGFSTVRIVSAA